MLIKRRQRVSRPIYKFSLAQILELSLSHIIPTSPVHNRASSQTSSASMAQTDLDLLIEMGFERARAELAVKKSGGRE
jgi:hypothetical protein